MRHSTDVVVASLRDGALHGDTSLQRSADLLGRGAAMSVAGRVWGQA